MDKPLWLILGVLLIAGGIVDAAARPAPGPASLEVASLHTNHTTPRWAPTTRPRA